MQGSDTRTDRGGTTFPLPEIPASMEFSVYLSFFLQAYIMASIMVGYKHGCMINALRQAHSICFSSLGTESSQVGIVGGKDLALVHTLLAVHI